MLGTVGRKEIIFATKLALKVKVKVKSLFATPWTVAYQAPWSMGYSRREYSGLPFPSPEDLPDPGIEPGSPALQADSLLFELQGRPLKLKKTSQQNQSSIHSFGEYLPSQTSPKSLKTTYKW